MSKAHGNVVHGHSKKGKRTSEYKIWENMKTRCLNPNCPEYKNYGGRGITICFRWKNSFENFFKDMGKRPKNKSLDRIDNNGNYKLRNCRWATSHEQRVNSRPKSYGLARQRYFSAINIKTGEKKSSNNQHAFARKYDLSPGNISSCLHGKCKAVKGWTFDFLT